LPAPMEALLRFISADSDRLLLLLPLAIAAGDGWSAWRCTASADARRIGQAAGTLGAGLAAWLVMAVVMRARDVAPLLWAPVFDRLLGVLTVTALGWMWVTLRPPHGQRWRALMAAGFLFALGVYAVWSARWADVWLTDPTAAPASLAVGLLRAWDGGQALFAGLLVVALATGTRRSPRWRLALVAALGFGSLLEVLMPVEGTFLPVWSRLGALAAGGCVVAAAIRHRVGGSVGARPVADGILVPRSVAADPAAAGADPRGTPAARLLPASPLDDMTRRIEALLARVEQLEASPPPIGPTAQNARAGDAPAAAPAGADQAINGAGAGDRRPGDDRLPAIEALLPELTDALQAPLVSIQGYRDLLARGGGLREEQVDRYLHRIDANLARWQVMLDNLIAVLALHGPQPADSTAVDVAQVIQAAHDRAQPQFMEKSLSVRLLVETALPPPMADRRSVARIVDNLLANASQRSPQGGEVTVRAVPNPGDSPHGGGVVISVHDWGGRVGGTGPSSDPVAPVGLKVVRLLAEHQGGQVWAENHPTGAGFHVRLPARRTA